MSAYVFEGKVIEIGIGNDKLWHMHILPTDGYVAGKIALCMPKDGQNNALIFPFEDFVSIRIEKANLCCPQIMNIALGRRLRVSFEDANVAEKEMGVSITGDKDAKLYEGQRG